MLAELRAENLLLIERAELRLHAGLNVITGETGAGKTILTHALDLLLGGKPRRGLVRPGAAEAYVEGVFALASPLAGEPGLEELSERLPLEGDEVVLARRVTAEGRTRAYLQGRSVAAADLRSVGSRLLAFYGQHEHRKLTLASAQLEVLDSFCGKAHLETRARFESGWSRARALARRIEEIRRSAGTRERDLDLLEFELREIEEAAPTEDELPALEAERDRLLAVETLRRASFGASRALECEPDEGGEGALGALTLAEGELAAARAVDPALEELGRRLGDLAHEARDVAAGLRAYAEALEADPRRLDEVEHRLDLLARLRRKYGGTLAAVLEHGERCRAQRERLSDAGEETASLERHLDAALGDLRGLAKQLSETRARGARRLERAVQQELGRLAMEGASFAVLLSPRQPEPANGALAPFGPRGGENAELMLAANPGVAPGPLREIASGGELSRVMLALLSVSTVADGPLTVVFDEIDAGVGGGTGRAVGERLRGLSELRQVVCITHLPQVASLAARHFRVVKSAGSPGKGLARASVEPVERAELIGELCRMMGADAADQAAKRHAERLLEAA